MSKDAKDAGDTTRKLPRLGDVVCWFAIKAAAARICERYGRGGDRAKLVVGKTYPISLHVTGTANGTAIDERITGRLARDADKKVSSAPKGEQLLAEALACLAESERAKVAERIKKGTVKSTDATRALAAQVIAARKAEDSRMGDVRLVPVA